jgi:hypothetical protein
MIPASPGYVNAADMGLSKPTSANYTATRGAKTDLGSGVGLSFLPSTNNRIGSMARPIIAADFSATYICRVKTVGGSQGVAGPCIVDTSGTVLGITPTAANILYYATDNGAPAFGTTGATHIAVYGDVWWKIVVAAGATRATARNVTFYLSANAQVWGNAVYTASYAVDTVGVMAMGATTTWTAPTDLLAESLV